MGQIKNIELLKAIRTVLQDLRAGTGLSQEAVITDIMDSKHTTLNLARIETGKGNISASTLYLLCDYYKITLSDFFKRVEEINNNMKIK